jgi:hypothetical protein
MEVSFSQPQMLQMPDRKPGYIFNVKVSEPIVLTNEEQPIIDTFLEPEDSKKYLDIMYEKFVAGCSKFFPRPLTIERVRGRSVHIVKTIHDDEEGMGVVVWQAMPISLCVSGTQIQVYWKLTKTYTVIDFEDEEEAAPASAPVSVPDVQLSALALDERLPALGGAILTNELVAVDDIAAASPISDKPILIRSPISITAGKDKVAKKLREARLQVKLAKFRAARAYEKYVTKYGDDLSESETDTEGATTDYTTGSDGSGSSD